jgi:hypothetical protein
MTFFRRWQQFYFTHHDDDELLLDSAWQQLWRSKDPVYVKFRFPDRKRKRSCSSEHSLDLEELLASPTQETHQQPALVSAQLKGKDKNLLPTGAVGSKKWTDCIAWPDQMAKSPALKQTSQQLKTAQVKSTVQKSQQSPSTASTKKSPYTAASAGTPQQAAKSPVGVRTATAQVQSPTVARTLPVKSATKNHTPQRLVTVKSQLVPVSQSISGNATLKVQTVNGHDRKVFKSVDTTSASPTPFRREVNNAGPKVLPTPHFKDLSRRHSIGHGAGKPFNNVNGPPASPLSASPAGNLIERHKNWLLSPGGSSPISPRLLVQPQSPPKKKILILQSITYK